MIDGLPLDADLLLLEETTPGRTVQVWKDEAEPGAHRARMTRQTKSQSRHAPSLTGRSANPDAAKDQPQSPVMRQKVGVMIAVPRRR